MINYAQSESRLTKSTSEYFDSLSGFHANATVKRQTGRKTQASNPPDNIYYYILIN